MKKRILITGSSGLLGSNLVQFMKDDYELFGIDASLSLPDCLQAINLDLKNEKEVVLVLKRIKPHVLIHCAAMTNVDACEDDPVQAHSVNAASTDFLTKNIQTSTHFIFVSTDSVFSGEKGNYSEDDYVDPLNAYAKSKLEAENCVKRNLKDFLIIRTNFFGWNLNQGQSFAEWIIKSLRSRTEISMFRDVVFTPLYAQTLVSMISGLIDLRYGGVLNLGSTIPISKYDFGISLARLFGYETSLIKPCSIDSFAFKAKRPKNTSLCTKKAEKIIGRLPSVEEEMRKFFEHSKILKN